MKKILIFLMLVLFIAASGCIVKKSNLVNVESRINKNIIYNLGRFPEDLLLLNNSKLREKDLLLALFEGLVKTDEQGNIVPGIAESWIIGKDDITYNFKLRSSARWSDGAYITAQDFVDFFKSILDSKSGNKYAKELYCIFGASNYNKDNKSFNNVAIRALSSNELQIRLNAPTQNFLYILSQPIYTLRKVDDKLIAWKKDYKKIVYSGPYIIEDINSMQELIFKKNSSYYNKEAVKSESIYITSIEGSEESLASFKNSKINVFANPPIMETNALIVNGEAEEIIINSGSSINFNMKKNASSCDLSFRKAISSCIDRNEIADKYLFGLARSASAYVPFENNMNSLGVKDKSFFNETADYAAAKNLLLASSSDKKTKRKLVYLNSIENKRICEEIVKNIKEAIDINISAVGVNNSDYEGILKNGDYDLIKVDYYSSYNDAISLLQAFVSNSEENVFGYKSKDFDDLMLKAKNKSDKGERDELLKKGEELLINDLPVIPLYFNNLILCRTNNIKGIYATKEGNIKLDMAYVEEN